MCTSPLPGVPIVGSIYSDIQISVLHMRNIRRVAHEIHDLYWFRYMVPYVQIRVDLLVRMLEFTGVADCSCELVWDVKVPIGGSISLLI